MNYPLAVRNTRRDFGYSENPASGLDGEMNRYKPPLKTPVGLLPPFCVISKMIHEIKPIDEWPLDDNSITQTFSITMDALICLRTFPGSSNAAWSFLETTASLESSTLYLQVYIAGAALVARVLRHRGIGRLASLASCDGLVTDEDRNMNTVR